MSNYCLDPLRFCVARVKHLARVAPAPRVEPAPRVVYLSPAEGVQQPGPDQAPEAYLQDYRAFLRRCKSSD